MSWHNSRPLRNMFSINTLNDKKSIATAELVLFCKNKFKHLFFHDTLRALKYKQSSLQHSHALNKHQSLITEQILAVGRKTNLKQQRWTTRQMEKISLRVAEVQTYF